MTKRNSQPLSGSALLRDASSNKGTAFTAEERQQLGLKGLLPAGEETLARQLERVLGHLAAKPDDLERYIYLQSLADRNEVLFFKTLMSDPARFVPLVYDPTIAKACQTYGHLYREPRGMYLTKEFKGDIAEALRNWPVKDVRFICVSSGGRILGMGDIGANGAPIPLGKLQLYTACAAVPPSCLLPIHLDIGTENDALRADPLYLGLRCRPLAEKETDSLLDEFVAAVNEVFPDCCIHFEDWKGDDALRLLDRYADSARVYNDDIQGTASVVLAGLYAALKIKQASLSQQRILFAGAGSAAIGIARLLVSAMAAEGIAEDEARQHIAMFDVNGLVTDQRDDLNPWQQPFAQQAQATDNFHHAVETFQPSIVIGVSTQGGLFSQQVITSLCKNESRPVIFALSNPTEKAECTAEQAYQWSKGEALFAAGVQFPAVTAHGKTFYPGQANNFYIFPALGLAVYATRPERITQQMFIVAAQATAEQVAPGDLQKGKLYPEQSMILETEITTAARLAEWVFDNDLAQVERPQDVRAWLESLAWSPDYADATA